MPQTQFINTTMLDPGGYAAQLEQARAERLAQMLQDQAIQPVLPAPNGGVAPAPISWTQGLAKLMQAYVANKAGQRSDALERGIINRQSDMFNQLLGSGGSAAPGMQGAPGAPNPAMDQATQSAGASAWAPESLGGNAGTMQALSSMLAPQPTGARGGSLPSLTGDVGRDRLIASQVGLQKYVEMVSAQYAATDQAKNDTRVGITPAMRKQMDIRESLRQLALPNAPGILNADQNGNPIYQPLAGLQQGIAGQAGALEGAKAANTPHYEPDPQHPGKFTVSYPPTPPALRQQTAAPNAAAPGAVPGSPQMAPAATEPARQFTAADLEAMKGGAQEGVKYASKLTEDAGSALQGLRTLSEMQNLLQNFTPGQFAPVLGALGAAAQSAGVSPDLVKSLTGINPGDAQAFQKGTATLATEAAKQVSNRVTQMEFKIFLQNNPNWMMQPDGIKRVIDFMGKGFNQAIDKQLAFSAYSKTASPDRWQTDFESKWNQQQRAAIKAGATNSLPANLTGVRTSTDVQRGQQPAAVQFHEGQTATDPATGTRYQFTGGQWNQLPPQPARPGQS
jgi:hypothetical protein